MKEHEVIRIKSEEDGCDYVYDFDTRNWRKERELTGEMSREKMLESRMAALAVKVLEGKWKFLKNTPYSDMPFNMVEKVLTSAGIGLPVKMSEKYL